IQQSPDARWPDLSGLIEFNELHVDRFCNALVCESVSGSSVFPTVTGDFVRAADPARGQHHCFGPKNFEAPAFALVSKSPNDTVSVFEERKNSVLHVHIDSLVNAMILWGADHLQAGAIPHMC